MGDLSLECNDVASSIECYKKAYEMNPSDREVLIKLATMTQTYFPEKVEQAIDYYNSLLEFGIDLDKIYYELGHLYLAKADKIHAVSAFKLAEEINPENPYYNNSLAYAYVKAELYDDAIEYYQRAIKINPDSEWTSIVCHALGAIYAEIKENYEAAEATFNAGMVLDPNNVDIQLSLGDLFMAQNDLDKAIKTYCDAISVDPLNYLTYAKTGLALWEKDYLEESIVAFHKSIELNAEFEIAQNNLGVVYLDGIGDPKASIEYFKNAININPNYTLAYFNLARAYQVLGNKYISYPELCKLEKIAEILDLYLNSGLCGFLSASKLKKIFGIRPFEFYSEFAAWLDERKFFDVLHSTVSLFEFVYEFLASRYDPELCESLVAFDYYRFTGSSTFPGWLRTMPDKGECLQVLNDEGSLYPFMDEKTRKIFDSMDKKHWFRKSRLVKFIFDENGQKMTQKVLFLYDKSALTVFLP